MSVVRRVYYSKENAKKPLVTAGEHVVRRFRDEGIDGRLFARINEPELIELGAGSRAPVPCE